MTIEGSAATSIRHIPAGMKKIVELQWTGINLDWGGGKWDDGTEYLDQHGIVNLIYDPYNRSRDYNEDTLRFCAAARGVDSATLLNVLCVIPDQHERIETVKTLFNYLKPNAKVLLGIWQGDKSRKMKKTSRGWQMNQPPYFYRSELMKALPWIKTEFNSKFIILYK
jgi:hypothetical protein